MHCAYLRRTEIYLYLSFLLVLAAAFSAGCDDSDPSNGGGSDSDAAVDASIVSDASIDADPPVDCTPGAATCDGRTLRICNDLGNGFADVQCPFTCEPNEGGEGSPYCSVASNLPVADQLACGSGAPRLSTDGNVLVEPDESNVGAHLRCGEGCGNGAVQIAAAGALEDGTIWFCLSEFGLTAFDRLRVDAAITRPVLFFVAGAATIDGTLYVNGGNADGTRGGQAGPGGGAGAGPAPGDSDGQPGSGPCAGQGGGRRGSAGVSAGGGGGAGFLTTGGKGGNGRADSGEAAPGGNAGATCGDGRLEPLVGGSGGGSGGDACDGDVVCGWPGGGGGGALQISATNGVTVSPLGRVDARGGAGFGSEVTADEHGGGGGGGAGGSLLFEAPFVDLTPESVLVEGGGGGVSGDQPGGLGAHLDRPAEPGASADRGGESGAGGGGSGGNVRINSTTPFVCANEVSPRSACSSGSLKRLDSVRPAGSPR